MQKEQPTDLLCTAEAAQRLGVTEHTLTTWRSKKTVNVPFVRVGRLVRYRESDLQAFIEANVSSEGVLDA